MYDCHPQPSHQLPFDQGVQIVISPSSVVYVPELIRVIQRYFASIETQSVVMTSSKLKVQKQIHIFTKSFWLLFYLAQTFPNLCSIKELTSGPFQKDFDSVVSCWEFIYVCFVWVEFKNPAELATDNSSVDIFDYYSGAPECQKS